MRPSATPASISGHGPWQMTPTGLPASKKAADEFQCLGLGSQLVRVGDPAGEDEPVVFARVGLADDAVGLEPVGFVEVVESLDLPGFRGQQLGVRAASRTALSGSVSSTCSTPSLAVRKVRKAIFFPFRRSDMPTLLVLVG